MTPPAAPLTFTGEVCTQSCVEIAMAVLATHLGEGSARNTNIDHVEIYIYMLLIQEMSCS